jgi:hypothetical protein
VHLVGAAINWIHCVICICLVLYFIFIFCHYQCICCHNVLNWASYISSLVPRWKNFPEIWGVASGVTRSKTYTKDPQMLGATIQNPLYSLLPRIPVLFNCLLNLSMDSELQTFQQFFCVSVIKLSPVFVPHVRSWYVPLKFHEGKQPLIDVRNFRNTVIYCLSCEVNWIPGVCVCVCVIVVAGRRDGELGYNFSQTHTSLHHHIQSAFTSNSGSCNLATSLPIAKNVWYCTSLPVYILAAWHGTLLRL